MRTASQILDLILNLKGYKSDVNLAELFNVSPNAVSSWRSRNSVPFRKIISFCGDEGLCLGHVFYGEGPLYKEIRGAHDIPSIAEHDASYGKLSKGNLIEMTQDILDSGTGYADALAANIQSFHEALETKKRLINHEHRLDVLEKKRQGAVAATKHRDIEGATKHKAT